jgi:hypothetical protein
LTIYNQPRFTIKFFVEHDEAIRPVATYTAGCFSSRMRAGGSKRYA